MVVVNCALRQDDIVSIVENIEVGGAKPYKFVKKQGLQIHFNCELGADQDPAGTVKKAIKATEVGKALFFSVNAQ